MKTESEIYVEAEMYAKTEKEKRLFGQRVSRCISTEEFQTEAYIVGFMKCQQDYEEKLRWIPVEEKHSPNLEHVLLKQSDGKITIGCYMSSQFNVEMCSDTIRVTHWRFIL